MTLLEIESRLKQIAFQIKGTDTDAYCKGYDAGQADLAFELLQMVEQIEEE